MSNIGELIEKRRKELGLTLEEVGNYVGVGKSTVKKWETGYISNMRRDKISLLSKILQISPTELIGDYSDDIYSQFDSISPIRTQRIPLLGEIACGKPIYCDEDRESYVEVGADIRADFCLRAKGDSMIGARIMDGDIVFIREQTIVENGEIAAVIIDDEATLKRVYYYKDSGKLILQAENPKYSPLIYEGEELNSIRILGKAIAFESNL